VAATMLTGLLALPALLIALRVLAALLLAGLLALSALLIPLGIIAGLRVGGLLLIPAAVLVLVLGTHKSLLGCVLGDCRL